MSAPAARPKAPTLEDERDVQLLDELAHARSALISQIGQRIVGQHEVVDESSSARSSPAATCCSSACRPGQDADHPHAGPGARADFKRVQFTPDLHARATSPARKCSKRTGAPASASSVSVSGPMFTNLMLADEINRTPPKTQAALLQAMQEHG